MAIKILLADDSLTIQKVVELTFSDAETRLMAVGSGDRAVQALDGFAPDIVLADVVMPGLTGYDVCEAVKQRPGGAFVPVVLLTGTFEPFDRARAERVGSDAIVTKPFDSHALQGLVRDLVRKADAAREEAEAIAAAAPAAPPEPPPTTILSVEELEEGFPPPAAPFEDTGATQAMPALTLPEPVPAPFEAGEPVAPVQESAYQTMAMRIPTPEELGLAAPPPPPPLASYAPTPSLAPPPPLASYAPEPAFIPPPPPPPPAFYEAEPELVEPPPALAPFDVEPAVAAPEPPPAEFFEPEAAFVPPAPPPPPAFYEPEPERVEPPPALAPFDVEPAVAAPEPPPAEFFEPEAAFIPPPPPPPPAFYDAEPAFVPPPPPPPPAFYEPEPALEAELAPHVVEEERTGALPFLPEPSFEPPVEPAPPAEAPFELETGPLTSPLTDEIEVELEPEVVEPEAFATTVPSPREVGPSAETAAVSVAAAPPEEEPVEPFPEMDQPAPLQPEAESAPWDEGPAVEIPPPPPELTGGPTDTEGTEPITRDIEEDLEAFESSGRVRRRPEIWERHAALIGEEAPADIDVHGTAAEEPEPSEAPESLPSELEEIAAAARLEDLSKLIPSAPAAFAAAVTPPGEPEGPAPDAAVTTAPLGPPVGPLSDADVDRIARRVVQLLSDKAVRDIAWEVVPEYAERLVRERIAEVERAG